MTPRAKSRDREASAPPSARVDVDRLAALARDAKGGDSVAFRGFVNATTPVVYRLCLRMLTEAADAEDATQEAYVRAWTSFPTLRDEKAALAWMCRIARYAAADKARARGRRRAVSADATFDDGGRALMERLAAEEGDPEVLLGDLEARRAVLAHIASLSEKHRLVLTLRELDGLSYDEIAAALGIPVGTVESRVHRARAALREKIQRAARGERGWRWW